MIVRFPVAGQGHVYNNLYEDIDDHCINSRMEACVRIENNYFDNAEDVWLTKGSVVSFESF